MPNAKVLSEKQAIVAALTEKLQNAAAGVIVDYKGITVAEDTALRAECRNNNVEYAVIKNTLLRFAFNNCGMNELDEQLNGTTSLAICADDPVAPARVIADYANKLKDKFEIKGLTVLELSELVHALEEEFGVSAAAMAAPAAGAAAE